MRNYLGPKKIRRLRAKTGLPIVAGSTRGSSHHHFILELEDGTTVDYWTHSGLGPPKWMYFGERREEFEKISKDDWETAFWVASHGGKVS